MTQYRVFLTTTASYGVLVEADSEADAMDKAEMGDTPTLCHQCARIDLGDWFADEENVETVE